MSGLLMLSTAQAFAGDYEMITLSDKYTHCDVLKDDGGPRTGIVLFNSDELNPKRIYLQAYKGDGGEKAILRMLKSLRNSGVCPKH